MGTDERFERDGTVVPLRPLAPTSLAALAACIAAVTWITWPLGAHLGTALARGGADRLYTAWVLAWQTHALTHAGVSTLDANIFAPTPCALLYGPTALGSLVLFAPVYLATGSAVLALNVMWLGSIALTAWALFLVVRAWTGSTTAGTVSAATLLTTPWSLWTWVPFCPHHATLFYLPLIIRLAARLPFRTGDAFVLAVLVALQSTTEIVYVAPAVFVPLAAVALARIARRSSRPSGLRLCAALALALLPLLPILAGHASVRSLTPDPEASSPWGYATGGDATWRYGLNQYPTVLPWGLLGYYGKTLLAPPTSLPLSAFVLLGAGLLAAWRRRRRGDPVPWGTAWSAGALWCGVGVALSLTPVVELYGQTIMLGLQWCISESEQLTPNTT